MEVLELLLFSRNLIYLAIFVYGFAKSEKDNLDNDELKYFKILAKDLLKISKQKYFELEKLGKFISIKE